MFLSKQLMHKSLSTTIAYKGLIQISCLRTSGNPVISDCEPLASEPSLQLRKILVYFQHGHRKLEKGGKRLWGHGFPQVPRTCTGNGYLVLFLVLGPLGRRALSSHFNSGLSIWLV